MANERVSQLTELILNDIQSNDILLATDVSQRESKKLEIGQLLLFIESSGSFSAYRSNTADTASYINGTFVDGMVTRALTASLSNTSTSSSYSNTSTSSSYSNVAGSSSYSSFCVTSTNTADTASYLKYLGTPNGTASYSVRSLLSDNSVTANSLVYTGVPNGTASYSITASNAIISSNSLTASRAITASNADTASYAYQAANSSTSNSSIFSIVAQTASFVQNSGPKFITPINIVNSTTLPTSPSGMFVTCSILPSIPLFTKTIILQYWISSGFNGTPYQSYVTSSTGTYRLGAIKNDDCGVDCSGQGMYPTTVDFNGTASIFLTSVGSSRTTTIDIIGYY